jgi:hypothetical protein
MNAVELILKAYREGHSALLLSGRSLYDFVAEFDESGSDGRLRPLFEALRRTLHWEFGIVFISYSLATGLNWFESWFSNDSDRQTVRNFLRACNLLELVPNTNEVVSIMRGISKLSRTNTKDLKWKDGRQMYFAVCFEFTEHLAPGSLANGTQTDAQLIVLELVHLTSQSQALRNSGNLICFHGRNSLVDELVCSALKHIHLPQPDRKEKQEFVKAAQDLYYEADFEEGLTAEAVVSLTINTPNRGIESLLRASDRGKRPLTALEIAEQKNRDVEQLSEGTLKSLNTNRVRDLNLVGKNIEKPQKVLLNLADCLLRGDSSMPGQVLLAGAPGVAKTDLALLVAHRGKVPAYQMLSPKGSLVGETERKARLQQQALMEWTPNVAFCDEISEAFPLERSDMNLDSGASSAVTATLLTALSDETRRGKSLLIATTNRPWAMGAAMRSRFTVLPVLFPLPEDFPAIIWATAKRIAPESRLDISDEKIFEAAAIFYQKGASPRHIRSALSSALLLSGKSHFCEEDVLFAAYDLCATTDFGSAAYADLWAIKGCSSRSFLPWSDAPGKYKFPKYLKDFVNQQTGEINETELNRKIAELKPSANV